MRYQSTFDNEGNLTHEEITIVQTPSLKTKYMLTLLLGCSRKNKTKTCSYSGHIYPLPPDKTW